jgi:hypothetical protein
MATSYHSRMHGLDTYRALREATNAGAAILEIGGGVGPWCGSRHIVDFQPFSAETLEGTRWGEVVDRKWTAGDYTRHDVCNAPLPFADSSYDVGFAGGVLEDLRDPVFVVREMQRVCRRVVIETPSRLCEQTKGFEHQRWCGLWHHRWMVYERNGELTFQRKTSLSNLPGCHHRLWPWQRINPADLTFTYVADSPFAVAEKAWWSDAEECADLTAFVAETRLPRRGLETNARLIVYRVRQWLQGAV